MPSFSMKQWIQSQIGEGQKKPLPLLSFPAIKPLSVTVRELISSSELQAKGMQIIAESFDTAAAVSFMDLSIEAECFGAKISVSDDEVPNVVGRLVRTPEEAEALLIPSVASGRCPIYLDAIRRAATVITDRPILAGIIGPFSLAARLLDVREIMMDCYDEPEMVHTVLKKCTSFLTAYVKAYREAGANGIVMAEPVSGLLSPALEEEFSAPYVKAIIDAVQDDTFAVIYHNCGGNVPKMLPSLLSLKAAAYHFGNAVDLEEDILKKVPADVLIMGNLDPAGKLRMGSVAEIKAETRALLERCSSYPNFLLSSGCDIPPMTPWENLGAFFEANRTFYLT